jgi:hypothetical protein
MLSGLRPYRFERDPSGRVATLFGAVTSGHVILTGARGEVRFSGGVTPSRGHQGTCEGMESLARQVASIEKVVEQAAVGHAVYGCPMFNSDECKPAGPACCDSGDSQ